MKTQSPRKTRSRAGAPPGAAARRVRGEVRAEGIGVSPGIAVGRVVLLDRGDLAIEARTIDRGGVDAEVDRFQGAVRKARSDVAALRRAATDRVGDEMARVLDTHILLLEDDALIAATTRAIRSRGENAESAFSEIIGRAAETLLDKEDEYFRDRASDLRDVERRVLRILLGLPGSRVPNIKPNAIVVAQEITISDAIALPYNKVAALVCEAGGRTSHTAILARSLGIPAVVGLAGATAAVQPDDLVVVDGIHGTVVYRPTAGTVRRYKRDERQFDRIEKELTALSDLPAVTKDHHAFELTANIDLPGEVDVALAKGARGIGLYRTEFLFLLKGAPPTEEEQYHAFRDAADRVAPHDVIFRTLDLGADKLLPGTERNEPNPFLGLRGVRRSLRERTEFETQLRAMLRASTRHNVKIMLPMVSNLEEVAVARGIFQDAQRELRRRGQPFDDGVEFGIMVETPAAAILAESFASEVDFFSIGTNDLIQYTIATDRGNDRVAYLYEPFHPAVIRLIHRIVDAAKEARIWVGVCGEMASDPLALLFLIGLGVDEISTTPFMVPHVKKLIRSVSFEDLRPFSRTLLKMRSAEEARALARDFVERRLRDLTIYI